MRTLHQIIEAAKGNEPVTEEELRYAICALDVLWTDDQRRFSAINAAHSLNITSPFERRYAALASDPKEFIGWDFDPANPEYQTARRLKTMTLARIAQEPKAHLEVFKKYESR